MSTACVHMLQHELPCLLPAARLFTCANDSIVEISWRRRIIQSCHPWCHTIPLLGGITPLSHYKTPRLQDSKTPRPDLSQDANSISLAMMQCSKASEAVCFRSLSNIKSKSFESVEKLRVSVKHSVQAPGAACQLFPRPQAYTTIKLLTALRRQAVKLSLFFLPLRKA